VRRAIVAVRVAPVNQNNFKTPYPIARSLIPGHTSCAPVSSTQAGCWPCVWELWAVAGMTSGNGRLRFARPRAKLWRAFAAPVLVAAIGLGLAVAATASSPPNHGHLTCGKNHNRVRLGHTCTLRFADGGARTGYGATPAGGHKVCFTTTAPNKVAGKQGNCTGTNSSGVAGGGFAAKKVGSAKVTAKESYHGRSEGSVTITVTVTR